MQNLLIGIVVGAFLSLAVWWSSRRRRAAPENKKTSTDVVRQSLEGIRAVGELVVLKVYTQQVVTRRDHLFGDWGEKFLGWLMSAKRTAIIFEFVVDFRFNLKSPEFAPRVTAPGAVHFQMPPFFYEIQLKDISIYDEKGAILAPILLPEWLGQAFGGRFSEKEKNELIRAARQEAEGLANQMSQRMIGEVQQSAEATLRSIAQGIGFAEISFGFPAQGLSGGKIDTTAIAERATHAIEAMDKKTAQ